MKKNLPTADELRSAAKTVAYRIAENRGVDPDAVRRMTDTDYGRPCFVVAEDDNHALVVYDNDPQTKFWIINRPGRLQSTEQSNDVSDNHAVDLDGHADAGVSKMDD